MNGFGELLKHWRTKKSISQFDLSLESGISSRHISFLETGRSNAGKDSIMRIACALNLSGEETNGLLIAAGLPALPNRMDFDLPENKRIRESVDLFLSSVLPAPAIAMNAQRDILRMNESAELLFERMLPGKSRPANLIQLLFHENGIRSYLRNWEQVAVILAHRLRREALLGEEDLNSILKNLDLSRYEKIPVIEESEVSLCMEMEFENKHLSFVSMISTPGTPLDIRLKFLRMEMFLPANSVTRIFCEKLLSENIASRK
ncbi:hypothetical protein A0128_03635 [Leptospira tipperaryensis]|uniref:HTH cro/C1-type domain-containing protein n=1 Tax=Leptospira tipperaryensis TaxID=2564040 RepID=A0A1D7UTU1_9LEPT|nr:helix-turn-helix transcriptional regulator [Leptospira tipperaryensis]AOP33032.1 hypothetical protein A0128_03635 [Leptospira tipperaryensis]